MADYKIEIIKSGNLPNIWYGECDNCGTIQKLTMDVAPKNNYKVLTNITCKYCSIYMKFFRSDTGEGKAIREKIILS